MDVSSYYTKFRIFWDELKEYHCEAIKEWMNFHPQESARQFLMRLNESYAQICAQLLMLDPLSPVSKVFSLVVHEERQMLIHCNVSKSGINQSLTLNSTVDVVTEKKYQSGEAC